MLLSGVIYVKRINFCQVHAFRSVFWQNAGRRDAIHLHKTFTFCKVNHFSSCLIFRCFLGQNSGPSQWPSCNRYVEAITIRLCDRFPAPLRQGRKTVQRWSLILEAYKKIQQMVLNNKAITDVIRIQLFDVNQHTISKW